MEKVTKKHFISYLLAMAYMALLAHVVLPHHHHQETAYFNVSTCPVDGHEWQDHAKANHNHTCESDSECVTLNHALVNKKNQGASDGKHILIPGKDFPIFPFLGLLNTLSHDGIPYVEVIASHLNSQPIAVYIGCYISPNGLRGPPPMLA